MHNYTFICFIFSGNGCTLLEMYFCLGVNKVIVLVLVLMSKLALEQNFQNEH